MRWPIEQCCLKKLTTLSYSKLPTCLEGLGSWCKKPNFLASADSYCNFLNLFILIEVSLICNLISNI